MNPPAEIWAEKREKGVVRYLLVDGILFNGGPFAVIMQIVGVFLLRDEAVTIGQYLSSPRTWLTFLLHWLLFGLVVGYMKWRRNEAAFAKVGN